MSLGLEEQRRAHCKYAEEQLTRLARMFREMSQMPVTEKMRDNATTTSRSIIRLLVEDWM